MPLLATSTLGSDDGFWARLSEPATPTPTTMAARSARRGRRRRSVTVPHLSMPRHGALALAAREEPFEALDPAESEPYDAPHAQGKQREDPVEGELVEHERADRGPGGRGDLVEGRPGPIGAAHTRPTVHFEREGSRRRQARDDRGAWDQWSSVGSVGE